MEKELEIKDRIRFSKAFIMVSEKAKIWVALFVEDRLRMRHNCMTVDEFIEEVTKKNPRLQNDRVLKKTVDDKIKSPEKLDLSALAKLIRIKDRPSIIDTHERKTPSLDSNHVGDLVERIVNRRNELVHAADALLDEDDYDDFVKDMKKIASKFEKINFPSFGAYHKEIEDVNKMSFNTTEVEKVMDEYKTLVKIIINTEILLPDKIPKKTEVANRSSEVIENESMAEGFSRITTRDIDNPIGKVVVGGVAGTVGLGLDVLTAPIRILDSILTRR